MKQFYFPGLHERKEECVILLPLLMSLASPLFSDWGFQWLVRFPAPHLYPNAGYFALSY